MPNFEKYEKFAKMELHDEVLKLALEVARDVYPGRDEQGQIILANSVSIKLLCNNLEALIKRVEVLEGYEP